MEEERNEKEEEEKEDSEASSIKKKSKAYRGAQRVLITFPWIVQIGQHCRA